jgi:hypothetical protein
MNASSSLKGKSLYVRLIEQDDGQLAGSIGHLYDKVEPILGHVATVFREFTDHSIRHSLALVDILEWLIPAETRAHLSRYDLYVLLACCALHDIGMAINDDAREALTGADEYKRFTAGREGQTSAGDGNRAFAEYIRAKHHRLSKVAIIDGLGMLPLRDVIRESSPDEIRHLVEPIADCCECHGMSISDLAHPLTLNVGVSNEKLHVSFVAVCLRLADALHVTSDRTPVLLHTFVNPADPASQQEWQKHLSAVGVGTDRDKVVLNATCATPEVLFALEDYVGRLNHELRESRYFLSQFAELAQAGLSIPWTEVENRARPAQVSAVGSGKLVDAFLPSRVVFEVDPEDMRKLLMGHSLYGGDNWVCIRELLQNSIDAVRLRALDQTRPASWEPRIGVKAYRDGQGREYLAVTDTGVGMDQGILQRYVSHIGRSYYRTTEFRGFCRARRISTEGPSAFHPLSEFGIGMLSTLMVADQVEINSLRDGSEPIRAIIRPESRLLVLRPGTRLDGDTGTTITLRLKKPRHPKESADWLASTVGRFVRFLEYPIAVLDEISGSSDTVVRRQPPASDNHKVISFDRITDGGIEGFVVSPPKGTAAGLEVSQDGVHVMSRYGFHGLDPFNAEGELNLTGSARMQLTVARDRFVTNDSPSPIIGRIRVKMVEAVNCEWHAQRTSAAGFTDQYESAARLVRSYFANRGYDDTPALGHDEYEGMVYSEGLEDFIPFLIVRGMREEIAHWRDFVEHHPSYRVLVGFCTKDEDKQFQRLTELARDKLPDDKSATVVLVARLLGTRNRVMESCGCTDQLAVEIFRLSHPDVQRIVPCHQFLQRYAFSSMHAGLLLQLADSRSMRALEWDDGDSECYEVRHVALDRGSLSLAQLGAALALRRMGEMYKSNADDLMDLLLHDYRPPGGFSETDVKGAFERLVALGIAKTVKPSEAPECTYYAPNTPDY